MQDIKGSHILGQFDTQVDGNHRWDTDRIVEIDVHPVSLDKDGNYVTDLSTTLAHVEVPGEGYSDDMWYGVEREAIEALPEHLRQPYANAIVTAVAKQGPRTTAGRSVGDTVFITEHRFPGEIEGVTVNGCYIVNMANSGELDEFRADELEDYDADRWEA